MLRPPVPVRRCCCKSDSARMQRLCTKKILMYQDHHMNTMAMQSFWICNFEESRHLCGATSHQYMFLLSVCITTRGPGSVWPYLIRMRIVHSLRRRVICVPPSDLQYFACKQVSFQVITLPFLLCRAKGSSKAELPDRSGVHRSGIPVLKIDFVHLLWDHSLTYWRCLF